MMKSLLEDYETGWYGIKIHLDKDDIDNLIEFLQLLKSDDEYHFHLFSTAFDTESGGIADIEFSHKSNTENSNMDIGA